VLKVKNWKELTRNRKKWNKVCREGQNPPRVVVKKDDEEDKEEGEEKGEGEKKKKVKVYLI
jgi:hypothetical protein